MSNLMETLCDAYTNEEFILSYMTHTKLLFISTDIPWVYAHYLWKLLIEELLDGNPSISVIGKKATWDNWTGLRIHCQYLCWHCIDKNNIRGCVRLQGHSTPGGLQKLCVEIKCMSPVSQVCMYLGYCLFFGSWSCSMWLNHAARVMYDSIKL